MKKMKVKNMLYLMLAVMLVISFAGCSAERQTAPPDETANSDETTTPDQTVNSDETANFEETVNSDAEINTATQEQMGIQMLHPAITDCSMQRYISDEKVRISERYPQLKLRQEEEARWTELSKSLNDANRNMANEAENSFQNSYEEAKAFLEETDTCDELSFSHETEAKAVRTDTVVFSVLYDDWEYMGGAHGYHAKTGVNYDTSSGKKLMPGDVITDMKQLTEILKERLLESYSEVLTADQVEEYLEKCKTDENLFCWVLDYEGITFYFNPEEMTAYAAGSQTVWIGFQEYPKLFNGKYTLKADSFVSPIFEEETRYTDVNGDGNPDEIRVNAEADQYGMQKFAITLNDTAQTPVSDCYSAKAYVVHSEKRSFLYVFCTGDSDYEFLQVYDLSSGTLESVTDGVDVGHARLGNSFENEEAENIFRWKGTTEAFTDPADFHLSTRLYALSTLFGMKNYCVDAEGLPKSSMAYYDVVGEGNHENEFARHEFTTLMDLEMKVVGEDGEVTDQTVTIPTGEKLWYLHTDDASWAEFQWKDGQIVRAEISVEFPQKVCGIELEKALDGVMFAG